MLKKIVIFLFCIVIFLSSCKGTFKIGSLSDFEISSDCESEVVYE